MELKTSAVIQNERQANNFERKLMKFWIQSFLLGVPKIIVGFRTQDGLLVETKEFRTMEIPLMVKKNGRPKWDGDTCVNFANGFLECESCHTLCILNVQQSVWCFGIND